MDVKNNLITNNIDSWCNNFFLECLYNISITVFVFLTALFILGDFVGFFKGAVGIGIKYLILAFLFSPYGIPKYVVIFIMFLEDVDEAIQLRLL